MFEQIVRGHVVDDDEDAKRGLLSLSDHALDDTIMDKVLDEPIDEKLADFLQEEEYDTDSMLADLDFDVGSNIDNAAEISIPQMKKIKSLLSSEPCLFHFCDVHTCVPLL